jgi:hypothetical protein
MLKEIISEMKKERVQEDKAVTFNELIAKLKKNGTMAVLKIDAENKIIEVEYHFSTAKLNKYQKEKESDKLIVYYNVHKNRYSVLNNIQSALTDKIVNTKYKLSYI